MISRDTLISIVSFVKLIFSGALTAVLLSVTFNDYRRVDYKLALLFLFLEIIAFLLLYTYEKLGSKLKDKVDNFLYSWLFARMITTIPVTIAILFCYTHKLNLALNVLLTIQITIVLPHLAIAVIWIFAYAAGPAYFITTILFYPIEKLLKKKI